MLTTDLAATLMSAWNSKTTIFASAFARIRREATRASVPRDIDSVSTVEHVKVITFTYTKKRYEKNNDRTKKIIKYKNIEEYLLSRKKTTMIPYKRL